MTSLSATIKPEVGAQRRRAHLRRLVTSLLKNSTTTIGVGIFLVYSACSLAAPLIAPHNPLAQHPNALLQGPSARFLLGTDEFGRDVLSRILYGNRESLYVGVASVAIAALVGGVLGIATAYYEGIADAIFMRIVDLGLGFPAIIIGVIVVAIRGAGSTNLAIAIAIYNIPIFIRVMRSATVQIKSRAYIEVARASGVRDIHVLRRHVIPNVASALLIQAGVAMSTAILLEAGLAYLGLGAPPPAPSLGGMLASAQEYLGTAPWYALGPGLSLSILVISLNMAVDGLRDLLDPRSSARTRVRGRP